MIKIVALLVDIRKGGFNPGPSVDCDLTVFEVDRKLL
jgi:hypothetical protein